MGRGILLGRRVAQLNMHDRYGAELSTPFVPAGTGWIVTGADGTHIVTFGNNSLRYQSDTTTPVLQVQRSSILTVGKTYRVIAVCSAFTSGSIKSDAFTGAPVFAAGVGTVDINVVAATAHFTFVRNVANVDLTLSSISVMEVA